MLPISFISAIMVAVGSQGTSNPDPIGYATVVFGPLAALVSGIGLLRRKAWGRYLLLALLVLMLVANGYDMARAPAGPRTYISPEGVKTTVLASPVTYSGPVFLTCLALIVALLMPRVRREFVVPPHRNVA